MKGKYNTIILLILIGLILSIFINIKHNNERENDYGIFLNHSFHLLDSTSNNIGGIINSVQKDEYAHLDHTFIMTSKYFFELERLLNDGRYFIDSGLDMNEFWGFDFIAEVLLGSANSNGTYYYGHHFLEDGIVSDKELEFLIELHGDLEVLLSKLANEDGNNANENISIEEFKGAIMNFFEKWAFENANGYVEGGESPFNTLLKN